MQLGQRARDVVSLHLRTLAREGRMTVTIGRRELLAALGGAAAAWPLAARAQQPSMPVIGFLSSAAPDTFAPFLVAFRQGLKEAGYVEGQNVTIEYRWAGDRYDQFPELAAELVRRRVALIVTTAGTAPLAAKAATSTIPIVFVWGGDPIKMGLVASFNKPGGNVTGVNILVNVLGAKRFGLLHELVPRADTMGVLFNPINPNSSTELREVQEAAHARGQRIEVVGASSGSDIDAAFGVMVQQQVKALLVTADGFFLNQRDQLIALTARNRMPAIYHQREFATGGGLMSYGTSLADAFHQGAAMAARILKGEKPADLPVLQPTKFDLVINLKTAGALGLTIPPGVLAIADEVIE
jgi:putative tryptophan/tyrosine transport system substrate-binding protein